MYKIVDFQFLCEIMADFVVLSTETIIYVYHPLLHWKVSYMG